MSDPKKATPPRPVVLCILDGFGERAESAHNAIALAKTPVLDRLQAAGPHARLGTSGRDVGLPEGQMGNSEVGHMNIGAGRVVMQDLPRIDEAVRSGALKEAPALKALIAALKAKGGACHLMGLTSPGGVHAHQDHMAALAQCVAGEGVPVFIHAFLDGRDTPPQSAEGFLTAFEAALDGAGPAPVRLGTLSGRYFAMDRDQNWDRIALAYDALVDAKGEAAGNWRAGLHAAYDRGETDEFVKPTVLEGYPGLADGDGVLFANFRADRARQILTALVDPAFDGFARPRVAQLAAQAGMVEYSSALAPLVPALFPPLDLQDSFGEVVARAGLTQLRIAETEKYAHVTYFFSGGREDEFPGEERVLIPSPKVATYDLKPEMSAFEVTQKLEEAIASGRFDVIVVNFANPDMVGHTGVLEAARQAIEAVDTCLGRLEAAATKAGGVVLVTADHGNAELMEDPDTGGPHTAHTTFDVPLLVMNPAGLGPGARLADGRLCDIAPTLLAILGVPIPAAMTGRSLLEKEAGADARTGSEALA